MWHVWHVCLPVTAVSFPRRLSLRAHDVALCCLEQSLDSVIGAHHIIAVNHTATHHISPINRGPISINTCSTR